MGYLLCPLPQRTKGCASCPGAVFSLRSIDCGLKHTLGANFTFAVLDDVLMSVDAITVERFAP